jgi:hypothetical protein
MANKIRLPNRSVLNAEQAKARFNSIRDKYVSRSDKSMNDVLDSVFENFEKFFSTLGEPVSEDNPINIQLDSRVPSKINNSFVAIEEDLRVAYLETEALTDSASETFNLFSTRSKSLMSKIRRVSSKAVTVKLLSDKFGDEFIYAGDDFTDRSKIDDSFPSQNETLDVPIGQNVLSLKRAGNENRTLNVVDITVTSNKSEEHYEGLYYALSGEARPEGGKYMFEEVQGKLLEVDKVYTKTGSSASQKYQVSEEDVRLRLRRASEDILKYQRVRMIDGDPRTFWEIEYAFPTSEELGKYAQDEETGEVTPIHNQDEIAEIVKNSHDKIDFDVEIIFKLGSSFVINWINLIPHIFGDDNWFQIVNIETSVDGQNYEGIEGLLDGKYENTLTPEVNSELSSNQVAATLSPSKFSYTGTGVWSFSPRLTKFIKMTVRQALPGPVPYNLYTYQLKNVGKTTTTVGSKSSGFPF